MKVFKPGTTVYLRKIDKPLEAKILSVKLQGEADKDPHVTYEVAWWVDASRTVQWITEGEINIDKEPTVKIGFKE